MYMKESDINGYLVNHCGPASHRTLDAKVRPVALARAILNRGAGFPVVWPKFAALFRIGTIFFSVFLTRFRKAVGTMT